MRGVTVKKDSAGNPCEVRYLTDDRDGGDERGPELCIGWGENGDWYVKTVPEGEHGMDAVRICTSGGAAAAVPDLPILVARMFRALVVAGADKD